MVVVSECHIAGEEGQRDNCGKDRYGKKEEAASQHGNDGETARSLLKRYQSVAKGLRRGSLFYAVHGLAGHWIK